jgi:hypothetical protein
MHNLYPRLDPWFPTFLELLLLTAARAFFLIGVKEAAGK